MSFFSSSLKRAKRFNYNPRYYDLEQAEFQEKKKKVLAEKGLSESDFVPDFRGRFKNLNQTGKQSRSKFEKIRLIIIIGSVLLIIAIFYLVAVLSTYIISHV